MKLGWVLVFASACAAIPESDAEERCLAHFVELDRTSLRCWSRTVNVDAASHCEKAYSVDDAQYEACLTYVRETPCGAWSDDAYKAVCLPAFSMRTW